MDRVNLDLASSRAWRDALAVRPAHALIVAAALLTFWPVLLGAYVADDVRLLSENPAVRSGDLHALLTQPMFGARGGYWRPATMLTLWLGNALGGAFGVHLLALLLHAANALAVRALAARCVPPAAATWVAVLFAVHPVQVESVGWCAAVNDPLWAAFALQAMLAALRWRERSSPGVPWTAAIWGFAALAAKETGVVALPLAWLAAVCLPAVRPARAAAWRLGATMAATGIGWLLLRALVQHEWPGQVLMGAAVPVATDLPALSRAAQLLVAEIRLLVWPWPTLLVRSVPATAGPATAALVALVAAAAGGVWWCRRRGRTDLLFAAALVVLPLLPPILYARVVGVYPIADRYLYLAVAGFALALGTLVNGRVRWLAWLLPAVLAPLTFSATWIWRDSAHLVANSLLHAPDDPMVLAMAGDLALDRAFAGDRLALGEARELYTDAVERAQTGEPGEQQRSTLANAKLGLAWCTLLRREPGPQWEADALAAFHRAIDAAPRSPMAWVGLAAAHAELRQFDAAEKALAAAQALDPNCAAARSGLERVRAARAAATR